MRTPTGAFPVQYRPPPASPWNALQQQIQQWHCRIAIVSALSKQFLAAGMLPPGHWWQLAVGLLGVLDIIAYQLAALWQSDRAKWTDDQRLAFYAAQLAAAGDDGVRHLRAAGLLQGVGGGSF